MTRFALEQTTPVPGALEDNTVEILERASRSLSEGNNVVVFPELAASGYVTSPEAVAQSAQTLDGPLVSQLTDLSRNKGGLVAVGFAEREDENYYNSVVLVGSEGPLLNYRKLHLFDTELDGYTPGDDLSVVSTEFGNFGVCVCYDLRFVEVMRVLSLKGADVVLAPAAWTGGFDASIPPEGIVRQAESAIVQANLDQVAVVAVSQAGVHPEFGVSTLGGSLAIDAYGEVILGPLSRQAADAGSIEIDIDATRAAQVRTERIRPRTDRRTDVYGLVYKQEVL